MNFSSFQEYAILTLVIIFIYLYLFLERIGVSEDDREAIRGKLEKNPFVSIQEEFKSFYKIDKHVKTSGHYIPPQEVKLPPQENGEVPTFQYIPVIDILEAIISDPGYKPSAPCSDNLIHDIKDGTSWKQNEYFLENPDAFTGHLYSDAVEIVNPLGPAKGFHKVTNVYFSLVDIDKSARSKTENIFLLLSVKDKDLKDNREAVYKPLIEDLMKLESGVKIGDKVVKLGIICHSGDNLECHQVGGFSTCFSSKDICRVCHLEKEEVDNISGVPTAGLWTRQEYDDLAKNLQPGETGQYGLKSTCLFNKLKAFHCVGQLPLDPMHDYMEKVGACDGLSILKVLVTDGQFSWEEYNSVLSSMKLEDYESSDRPPAVKPTKDKLPGKAMAVSLHIRLMPFIIWRLKKGNVEDSDVLDLLVLLNRINEYLLADTLHVVDIDHFQDLLVDYFAKRTICSQQFPVFGQMTPKYHYLGIGGF
jgi:hypothetical protein